MQRISAVGPSRKCSGFGCLVANGGKADVQFDRSNFAFDPLQTRAISTIAMKMQSYE